VNRAESNFRRLIGWQRLGASPDTDLIESVRDHAHRVITKPTYGAVAQVMDALVERDISAVYLCGIDTDVCVLQNAAGLFDAGVTPYVLFNACGTNGGPAAQHAALHLLRRTIGRGQVLTL